jgi:hypothetical protein
LNSKSFGQLIINALPLILKRRLDAANKIVPNRFYIFSVSKSAAKSKPTSRLSTWACGAGFLNKLSALGTKAGAELSLSAENIL